MKFFMTKYALSDGIKECEGRLLQDEVYAALEGYMSAYKIGTEVFTSRTEAIANAEQRRIKKIASVQKQIKKLEALKFK